MRALLLAALVAAQEVYRFDFSLDDQPLSGEFTSDHDLWQLAADWSNYSDDWHHGELLRLQPASMREQLSLMHQTLRTLREELKG